MNPNATSPFGKQSIARKLIPIRKCLILVAAFAVVAGFAAMAQDSAPQERLAAAKKAITENQQRLHQYQWIETTQLTLKGDAQPPKQNLCQYGPGGHTNSNY
jgi:hypothetical protein